MNLPDFDERVRLREIDPGEGRTAELLVDDVPARHGQFPDGTFFLYENAYVWSDDLRELGRQLVVDRAEGRVPAAPGRAGEGD